MKDNFYTTKVEEGQNLFDLALQMYGDVGEVWRVIADNAAVAGLDDELAAGLELKVQKEVAAPLNAPLMNWYRKDKRVINTGGESTATNYILQENADKILQENNSGLTLEN